MYDFLDRLINIALPRTKRLSRYSGFFYRCYGNYTLGIREHTIFPETSDEDLRDVFGFAINVGTTAKTKEEAKAFLSILVSRSANFLKKNFKERRLKKINQRNKRRQNSLLAGFF